MGCGRQRAGARPARAPRLSGRLLQGSLSVQVPGPGTRAARSHKDAPSGPCRRVLEGPRGGAPRADGGTRDGGPPPLVGTGSAALPWGVRRPLPRAGGLGLLSPPLQSGAGAILTRSCSAPPSSSPWLSSRGRSKCKRGPENRVPLALNDLLYKSCPPPPTPRRAGLSHCRSP